MKIQLKSNAMYVYRDKVGISRDELSRRMGVATTTAYRVESGQVEPSPRFIAALMHETGQPFEVLFEVVTEAVA